MIKKVIIPIVATALFIVAVGILMKKTSTPTFMSASPTPTQASPTVGINGKSISVEIAKTPEDRKKGLSERSSLDTNAGMLFVFDDENTTQTFWMKGMFIPLDIIWIDNGKIIRIDKNVAAPAANTPDNKIKTYSAGRPVDYVLEVNAGFSDSNSIKVGDSVSFSGI